MLQIKAYFQAEAPLVVSDGSTEGMMHRCLSYVPGNMLLGALATRWRKQHPHDDDSSPVFADLFLNGTVTWGHALPTCGDRACLPTPPCFEYVKKRGRLPHYGTRIEGAEQPLVFNGLRAPERGATPTNEQENTWQRVCEEGLKRKRLPDEFIDVETFHLPDVRRQHAIHVSLDPHSRRAADSKLFAYEALVKGTRLCATITCPKSLQEQVLAILGASEFLHVGHARSAGYGTLRLTNTAVSPCADGHTISPGEHVLYLASAYFPAQSWLSPLEGLEAELKAALGTGITLNKERIFARPLRLEGFQGLWQLPRPTRTGFAAGSVFSVVCTQQGALPLALGGWQQEGYGCIQIDPPFLASLQLVPTDTQATQPGTARQPSAPATGTVRDVWRRRTLKRIARQQANDAVWGGTALECFFTSLKGGGPSQSQRGNIRQMVASDPATTWAASFMEILEKQPGRQWKNAVAGDPFSAGQYRSFLDKIMLDLFDVEKVDKLFAQTEAWNLPELPGGAMSADEQNDFRTQRHQRLLLELLRRWEKLARTSKENK